MKKSKQILCLFLSVCMIFTCMIGLSTTASAATGDFAKNVKYFANDVINFPSSGVYIETDDGPKSISGTKVLNNRPDYTGNTGVHFCCFAFHNLNTVGLDNTYFLRIQYPDNGLTSTGVICTSGTGTQGNPYVFTPIFDTPTVPVSSVTLNPDTAVITVGGDPATLTATVTPNNATDRKVKWGVTGGVKLYSDSTCQTEVGTGATNTLTVYAKGTAAGSASVTVTSNADNTKSASYAITVNPDTYLITYKPGDNASGDDLIDETDQDTATLLASYPADWEVDEGYALLGWTDGRTNYGLNAQVPLTGDLTLTAVWVKNPEYSTAPDEAGTVEVTATDTGFVYTATPARGYSFDKWILVAKAGESQEVKNNPYTLPVAASLAVETVAAVFVPNKYTITFDTLGGTEIAPITQDYGTDITAPADPVKDGYVFSRWDTRIPDTMPAYDMVITALYVQQGDKPVPSSGSGSSSSSSSSSSSDVSGSSQSSQKMWAQLNDDHTVTVGWDKISGASKYVLMVEKDGKDVELATTSKNKVTIKMIAPNNVTFKYKLKVKQGGVLSDAPTGYTTSLKVYYKPVVKLTNKDGKVTASWKKVPNATSYRVYKLVNGKMKLVTETSKNSVRFSDVKSGKTYTYAVKACVNGEWTKLVKSDRASIKAK